MTDLNTLTIAQLTAFYNEKAGASIKKFSTKADGIRRCTPFLAPPAKTRRSKHTITAVACQEIRLGKTNAEVWAILQEQFKLDDSKKHYPTWYRSYMKRKGI